jgi:hypothetical protein
MITTSLRASLEAMRRLRYLCGAWRFRTRYKPERHYMQGERQTVRRSPP